MVGLAVNVDAIHKLHILRAILKTVHIQNLDSASQSWLLPTPWIQQERQNPVWPPETPRLVN